MKKVGDVESVQDIKDIEEIEGSKIYCIDCSNCIKECCFINKFRIPDKNHLGEPSPYYQFGCDDFDRIITIERLCENYQKYGAYWSDWDTKLKDIVLSILIENILKIKRIIGNGKK